MIYRLSAGAIVLGALGTLALSLSPISPQPWSETSNKGYVGVFEKNRSLESHTKLDISPNYGPEDILIASDGTIFTGTSSGWILKKTPEQSTFSPWIDTQGHPLGLSQDQQGNLYIADALRGLLRADTSGQLEVLASDFNNTPLLFVDDVEAKTDGTKVYFTDVTTRHSAKELGVDKATVLETLEHSGTGRVFEYDVETNTLKLIVENLQFANGITLSKDESALFVTETTAYRILKHWISGPKTGQSHYVQEGLPGFPDNINRAPDGTFWVALFTPRHPALEWISDKPWLRKLSALLPDSLQLKPESYGHIFSMTEDGQVLQSFQSPSGIPGQTTGAQQRGNTLYVGNLNLPYIAKLELK